ncbi:hypothetical protein Cni_G14782 [Canna indica]|uniref:Agenet domain-containing protein n=1 Tax=Canna indica TaxID=4628 RepID=A0AAQ3KEY8_9LILI|nr:hypothetical protein Cni_G14782 [Canna indica]
MSYQRKPSCNVHLGTLRLLTPWCDLELPHSLPRPTPPLRQYRKVEPRTTVILPLYSAHSLSPCCPIESRRLGEVENTRLPMGRPKKHSDGEESSRCRGRPERFPAGARVEIRSDDDGFRGAWYEATVIRRVSPRLYEVAYAALVEDDDPSRPLHEVVRSSNIRPQPPSSASTGGFGLHDLIEAFHNDGWWAGAISIVLDGPVTGRYIVSFPTSREEVELEASKIRRHLLWISGRWVPAAEQGSKEIEFSIGARVEVSRQREKYGTSWLSANITKVLSSTTFQVEYESLGSESNGELLTEIVDVEYIRPFQPYAIQEKKFALNDKVEVLYHSGWVLGRISKILDGFRYVVKILHGKERVFDHTAMRHSQYWNGKEWVVQFQQKIGRPRGRPVSNKKKSQAPKRYLSPSSLSTSSDEGEIICKRGSFKLNLKDKKSEVQLESLPRLKNSKKVELWRYYIKRNRGLLLEHSASPTNEINICAATPMAEHSYSLEQHSSETESPSFGGMLAITNVGTLVAPNPSSSELHYMSNMNGMTDIPIREEYNGITDIPTREESPPDFNGEGSEHQPRANKADVAHISNEASGFLQLPTWRNYTCDHGLPAFVTKKRTKLVIQSPQWQRRSVNDDGVQDESNKMSREKHSTKFFSQLSTPMGWKFKKSRKFATNEVILSKSHPLCQRSNMLRLQGSPPIVDVVDPHVSDAFSICRDSKQVDHGHFGYITPRENRLAAKSLTIKFLMTQSSPDIILSSYKTDTSGEICDMNTEDGTTRSVPTEGHTNKNQTQPPSKIVTSEDDGSLVHPTPLCCLPPIKEVPLPFSKTSAMWESIQSVEVFQVMRQQPHFRQLEQYAMEFREGMAIGLMVSFANLFASIKKLHIDEDLTYVEERLKALGPFEANGFDVHSLRSRLQELIEIQVQRKKCRTTKEELEAKILKIKDNNGMIDSIVAEFEKSIMELEQNLTNLQERRDSVAVQRTHNQSEIPKLEMDVLEAEEAYHSAVEKFYSTLSSPW